MRTDSRARSSRHGIGLRLFIWLTSITILLSILSTVIIVHREQDEIKESLIKEGLSLAAICSESLRTAVFAEDKGMIETVVQGIIMQEGVVSVTVLNDNGKVLFLWSKMHGHAGSCAPFPPVTPRSAARPLACRGPCR